jgi:hypothetical protein
VAGYRVLVDDNFHYMEEGERAELGVFATADEAITVCKRIVDDFLQKGHKPGMSAADMYERYTSFGDDPFIVPVDPKDPPVTFSAWTYAKERSEVLAAVMR